MKREQLVRGFSISNLVLWVLFWLLAGTATVLTVFADDFLAEPLQVQVDQAIPHGRFRLGVGSRLTLRFPRATSNVPGVFLGRLVEPNGTFSRYMILDEDRTRIYLTARNDVRMPAMTEQPVLRQYDQIGGTCTGYAIDHLLQQLYWSGFPGNGQLRTTLSTEKGRTQLLVDAINEYYLVLQHRYSILGILKKFGKRFGFGCELKQFTDANSATRYLVDRTTAGVPVLVAFDTGPNMVTSSYEIMDYESREPAPTRGKLKDRRLWIPRKIGERNSGGHSVVAIAAFVAKGRTKLLMLDSDWEEPRVWDVEKYLSERAAIKEVEFYTCR